MGGLTGTPSVPERRPQTLEQLDYAHSAVDRLAMIVSELDKRLSPITRPQAESESVGEKEQELTPIAGDIRSIGRSILRNADRIETILNRLEI